ncbi:hypothetical protein ACHAQH_007443 [Verticillium albo-atrum]
MLGTTTICTLDSCRDATTNSFFGYRPNIIATATFIAVWGTIVLTNAALALRAAARATLALLLASLGHILGWFARIAAWRNPWARWPWMQATVVLSAAPVPLSISMTLAMPSLLRALGASNSPLKPRTLPKILLPLDILSLLLQTAGFTIAFRGSSHTTPNINTETRPGAICLLAAYATNAVTLLAGLLYVALVALRAGAQAARSAKLCAFAIILAAALPAARVGFRGALLSGGLRGRLAREELLFVAFDGAPAALAGVLLVVAHPVLWLAGENGDGGKGTFAKLHDVEFREVVPGTAKGADVPLVYELPRSYDLQPYDPGRYEMSRGGEGLGGSREQSPRAYGDAYRDRDEGDVGVRPYGSGGL